MDLVGLRLDSSIVIVFLLLLLLFEINNRITSGCDIIQNGKPITTYFTRLCAAHSRAELWRLTWRTANELVQFAK